MNDEHKLFLNKALFIIDQYDIVNLFTEEIKKNHITGRITIVSLRLSIIIKRNILKTWEISTDYH